MEQLELQTESAFRSLAIAAIGIIMTSCVATQQNDNALMQGYVARATGDLEQALDHFDDAVADDAMSVEALFARGQTLHEMGEYEDAIRTLDRARVLNPDNPDIYLQLGWSWLGEGDARQALNNFTRAARLRENDHEAGIGRGRALLVGGDTLAAIRQFDQVRVNGADDDPAIYEELGYAWLVEGDSRQAFNNFNKARSLRDSPPRPNPSMSDPGQR